MLHISALSYAAADCTVCHFPPLPPLLHLLHHLHHHPLHLPPLPHHEILKARSIIFKFQNTEFLKYYIVHQAIKIFYD